MARPRATFAGLAGVLLLLLIMTSTVEAAASTVTGVSPSTGSTAGGTVVTVRGSGFNGTTAVRFGAVAASSFEVRSNTTIVAVAPPRASAGQVHVVVVEGADDSGTPVAAHFNYVAAPTVDFISPVSGSTEGGEIVTITGAGFGGLVNVRFDGAPAEVVSSSATEVRVRAPAHAAGRVHVRVTAALGTSLEVPGDDYTYIGRPTVTSISPRTGSTGGGATVTIEGTNLTGATSVAFGDRTAVPTETSPTALTVIAPPHPAGVVHLRVTTPYGTSPATVNDDFTYVSTPVVLGITPQSGSTAGGTVVTISGHGFTGAWSVDFGGTSVVPNSVSDSRILVTSPPHAAGLVHLRVTGPSGTSASTAADNFTYEDAPVVSGVSPRTGSTAGGTLITISGRGFAGATTISFGDLAVAPTSVTDASILVVSPPNPPGVVHLKVTTPAGVSADTADDNFTYIAVPTVTDVSPRSGPETGGTLITISGFGFTGAFAVDFGNTSVVPATVTDTKITVVSPAREPGLVHLRVRTPSGRSEGTSADDFTYTALATATYSLSFRWSLIVWAGRDGMPVADALAGRYAPVNPAANDVTQHVLVLFRWDGGQQRWLGYFVGSANVPGVNDFTTLTRGAAYWVAVRGPAGVNWTVLTGP
ncbi:MAG: IPT/TIG domain-containing protein [Dehalococcoidia bacterium]